MQTGPGKTYDLTLESSTPLSKKTKTWGDLLSRCHIRRIALDKKRPWGRRICWIMIANQNEQKNYIGVPNGWNRWAMGTISAETGTMSLTYLCVQTQCFA